MKTFARKASPALIVAYILSVGLTTASATIINDVGPSWRGDANTTYQAWGFDDATNPSAPELEDNPYVGDPSAEVYGEDLPPVNPWDPYNTFWKNDDNGHQGVWRIYGDSFLLLYVPNNPVQNEQKIINFQMTYYASGETGADPEMLVFSTPTATSLSVTQMSKIKVDEHFYYHATWEIIIEPNPNEEWIKLQPRDCTLYIDEVVIDTICIPEPSSVVLLVGMSGMIVFVRRKFIV